MDSAKTPFVEACLETVISLPGLRQEFTVRKHAIECFEKCDVYTLPYPPTSRDRKYRKLAGHSVCLFLVFFTTAGIFFSFGRDKGLSEASNEQGRKNRVPKRNRKPSKKFKQKVPSQDR